MLDGIRDLSSPCHVLLPVSSFFLLESLIIGFEGPGESPLLRVLEVLVVTIKNWRVAVPENSDELYEIREFASKGELIPHTNQFRQVN